WGERPARFGRPRRSEGGQASRGGGEPATAAGTHPRAERKDRVALVAVAHQHATSALERIGRERGRQPRLADARLSDDLDDTPAALHRLVEQPLQLAQLRLAAQQRGVGDGEIDSRVNRAGSAATGRPRAVFDNPREPDLMAQDVVIETPRLVLRLRAQFLPKGTGADLVLAERRPATSLSDIEPHERAMHDLLKGIERQQTMGGLDSRMGCSLG